MLNIFEYSIAKMKIPSNKEEADNLASLMKAVNKAQFARQYKMPGGASMISQHISGHRPISLEAAVIYARGLGLSLADISPRLNKEIESAKGFTVEDEYHVHEARSPIADYSAMPPNSFSVNPKKLAYPPVLGKSMGGMPDNLFTDEGRVTNGHDEYGEVYSSDENAFITRVEGNSMFPKYFHGGYALVEPNTPPEVEDDILIKVRLDNTGNDRVMLKRLVSRRGGVVLSSYNDQETFTFSDEDIIWMYYVAYPVPARKIKQRV
jgi:phage repressor protein C with HTH and peptisase S24 domain